MKRSEVLAKALQDELEREQRVEGKFGSEPDWDGAVVAFRVQFMPRDTKYIYAAVRAGKLWYTTGPRSPKGYTWSEFVDWLDGAHKVTKFSLMVRDGE